MLRLVSPSRRLFTVPLQVPFFFRTASSSKVEHSSASANDAHFAGHLFLGAHSNTASQTGSLGKTTVAAEIDASSGSLEAERISLHDARNAENLHAEAESSEGTAAPPYKTFVDSHRFLTELHQQKLTKTQAVALIDTVQAILHHKLAHWLHEMPSKADVQCDFAALRRKQRTAQIDAAKSIAVFGDAHATHKARVIGEAATAVGRLRDVVATLRTEVQTALGEHRDRNREDAQRNELELHRIAGGLRVSVENYKAALERLKLRACFLFSAVMATVLGSVVIRKTLLVPAASAAEEGRRSRLRDLKEKVFSLPNS